MRGRCGLQHYVKVEQISLHRKQCCEGIWKRIVGIVSETTGALARAASTVRPDIRLIDTPCALSGGPTAVAASRGLESSLMMAHMCGVGRACTSCCCGGVLLEDSLGTSHYLRGLLVCVFA